MLIIFGTLIIAAVVITACSAGEPGPVGPAGPEGPQGEPGAPASIADLTCTECHNDTALITGKKAPWETSVHGAGTATEYAGGRGACAACHSGASFSKMVAEGSTPNKWEGDFSDVTHQDCRTCHQIHTTYTSEDWALESTAEVPLFAFENVSYDGGNGNLCGICHQPRRVFTLTDGLADVNSTHWGPHHGPQTAVLMGIGGAGEPAEGKPAAHYSMIENTCVSCHLGENDNHTFLPSVAACKDCHTDAENFDINGLQTDIDAMIVELGELLEARGLWQDGHPVVGKYSEEEGAALWNYILIAVEDSSRGVHNPSYTKALLEWSIEQVK
ncbi:MAG TPA: hypothetical protein DCX53_03460 [Anaerolineae bacterium]|nr:hypothetical protein [Anaerolineae bacterium]